MEASETFIKGRKCLGFQKTCLQLVVGNSDQVEEREQAGAQLIFLLGAQVDKLATLFTAFFFSPLYHKNC
jgi:hypothetical protein